MKPWLKVLSETWKKSPYDLEQNCIEEHIVMTSLLRQCEVPFGGFVVV